MDVRGGLAWGDLEAFIFDQFLHAVGDEEVVLGVLVAYVAGFEVAEAVGVDDGFVGGFLVLPISLHELAISSE